jgi:molybdenum cofactor guanylyltransferase
LKLLGAILAGGQARRFGSDKAHARIGGERLIDIVARTLGMQCDGLVVCGREETGFECIPDSPNPGLGPLGGLNAALQHAEQAGFDAVLSCGCDVPNLPSDLALQLGRKAAAFVDTQPVIGLWPVGLAPICRTFLGDGGRALYAFAERVGAVGVRVEPGLRNINRPGDLPDQ